MTDGRIERVDADTATAEQGALIAKLNEVRGRIPTPFNIWLHNPGLAEGMDLIGAHIDNSPVISKAESEVAILSTAVFWDSPYVIANHRRHALKAGLPESAVNDILEKRRPEGLEGQIAVVSDAVCDILEGARVDEPRFAHYVAELGRPVIAELLVTISYFTAVSLAMTLHDLTPKE